MADLTDPIVIINVRAPQWSSDTRIPTLVQLAELQTSTCFGDTYALAVALRVLHGLAIEKMNGGTGETETGDGSAGSIASAKEGDLAETRNLGGSSVSKLSGAYAGLEDTSYGRELISLTDGAFSGPITRFSTPCP